MVHAVDIALIILCFIVIFIHAVGIHLFVIKNPQCLFILSLSISEVAISAVRFSNMVTRMILSAYNIEEETISIVDHYFETLIFTGLSLIYYCSILYVTIDRLLACLLNVEYPLYCTMKRAKFIMGGTLMVGILFYSIIEILHGLLKLELVEPIYFYFYLPFDGVFVLTAVTTYTMIFFMYRELVRRRKRTKKVSSIEIYRQSKFYVSTMLILTFLVLNITADLIYLILIKIKKSYDARFVLSCIRISYSVSFIADGLIYIFLQRSIRRELLKKISRRRTCKIAPTFRISERCQSIAASRIKYRTNHSVYLK